MLLEVLEYGPHFAGDVGVLWRYVLATTGRILQVYGRGNIVIIIGR